MFNGNRGNRDERATIASMASQSGGAKRGMFSVLGPDVTVTGNVAATSDLHIDGRVEGDVTCASLAQGTDSQIFGSVTAETARLAGTVEGSVRARDLTIERSARISGDVEYEAITIENGGHVEGRLRRMSAAAGLRTIEAPPALTAANEQAA